MIPKYPDELKVSDQSLSKRWQLLSNELRARLALGGADIAIQPGYASDTVTAGLIGRVCERVERHRGRAVVAPLASIRAGPLKAWFGYHEVWEARPGKIYAFHHLSVTVFLGREGELFKAQIFRSEWPGIRCWTPSDIGFQSPGAGQPHWQFDALKTLRDIDGSERAKSLARVRGDDPPAEVHGDFGLRILRTNLQEAAIERIHFASAAPWWQKQQNPATALHMNAPPDVAALHRWALGCISYIRQEVARC
jgi:hypothetical protein